MVKLQRLWPALEAPFGVAGVRAELVRIFGDELPFAEPFLRRLPEPSEIYPCEQLGWSGCPRRIATHPDGRIVAVCGCDPPACETLELRAKHLVCYELDVPLLCKCLGPTLGFTVSPAKLAGRQDVWSAGFFTGDGAVRSPVFLILPASRHELRRVIDHLLAEYATAFIVLVPTLRLVDPSLEERLGRREARLVVLQDALVVADGKLLASQTLPSLVVAAAEQVAPPQPAPPAGRPRLPRSAGSPQAVRAVVAYMEGRGLGVTQFATQVDTTDRTVRNFLKRGKMRRSSFKTMAARMGLTTEQLLRGEVPKETT